MTESLINSSLEACAYNCKNGRIFDFVSKSFSECPDCKTRRRSEIKESRLESGEDLEAAFGFGKKFLSSQYVWESLIPDGERVVIDDASLDYLKEQIDTVYNQFCLGQKPERSYCFGLGIKGRLENLVYPLMVRAYQKGLTVCPYLSVSEYSRMVANADPRLDGLFASDVLFVLVNEGVTLGDLAAAKGLMQVRSIKGNVTIFVTTWTIEACSGLVGYPGDTEMSLGRAVFVEYLRSKGKHSNYINGLLGVANGAASASTSSDDDQYVEPQSAPAAAVSTRGPVRNFRDMQTG